VDAATHDDVRQQQREQGTELMHRISASGHVTLIGYYGHPEWLVTAASQILAATGGEPILYVAHTLEEYDSRSALESGHDPAEGYIVAITSTLLVKCEFSASRVRAMAIPLRAVASLDITRITDVRSNSANWPDRLEFEVRTDREVFSFPPSRTAAYAGLPAVLDTVRCAMVEA
jgi:hypothetical protein